MFTFSPQLANNYSPTKDYQVSHWFASPKFDGVRAHYFPGDDYIPQKGLFSRTLKTKFVGLEHIEDVLKDLFKDLPTIIDGELYIENEGFDSISGIVRKSKKINPLDKQRVKFHVFALWQYGHKFIDTETMITTLRDEIPTNQTSVIAVDYTKIENNAIAIQEYLEKIKNDGISQEGIMLRHPTSAYDTARSNDLLKVKNFEKNIFTITGFTKGTGKYKDSLGNLKFSGMINNQIVNGKVGTGFSDIERRNLWQNQSDYLGKTIELVYMSFTKNNSVRFPVFSKMIG
ncbi:MAG: Phormidium phage MIS-PhV1B [Cyanobacteriota bacterium]|jgi:ATP-dependent DNA ligase